MGSVEPGGAMEDSKLELLIPSQLEYLGVLAKVVEGLQDALHLTDEETFAVSTALIEAGTNAIQHGGAQSEGPVRVTVEAAPDKLVMAVQDDGCGFDLSRVDTDITALDHL